MPCQNVRTCTDWRKGCGPRVRFPSSCFSDVGRCKMFAYGRAGSANNLLVLALRKSCEPYNTACRGSCGCSLNFPVRSTKLTVGVRKKVWGQAMAQYNVWLPHWGVLDKRKLRLQCSFDTENYAAVYNLNFVPCIRHEEHFTS